jgi:site-specific DNA recombinase
MKKNTKTALYIRVSTEAQAEEGYSVDAQKQMLTGWCRSKNITDYELYTDGGRSGANLDRPELLRLIDDIKSGSIDTVAVYKLDRLSRSQKDTLYLIEDVLNPNGVAFVSLNENMDTSTPIGRAMLGIMSAFAQLERETIRERTRMGMYERIKSGLWRGGGKLPFGYDYDKESGKLTPNGDAETVKQVFSLYLSGMSALTVSKAVGLKYERLASQILKRITYTGATVYNGEIFYNTHTPIISPEIFERTRIELLRRGKSEKTSSKCLLAGMIVCGVCGHKMRYQKWSGGKYKIYCYSQDKSKSHIGGDIKCDNTKTDAVELEYEVLSDLFSMKVLQEKGGESKDEILSSLISNKENLKRRLTRLYSLYSDAEDDALLSAIDDIKKQIAGISALIDKEKSRKEKETAANENRKKLRKTEALWQSMSFAEKRGVLRELIDKIVITYDNVDIYYSDDLIIT